MTEESTKCPDPNKVVITFKKVGRLGNQISSYVNMIMMEKIFNMTAFFPASNRHYDVRKKVKSLLENVTMAVWVDSLKEKCSLEVVKNTKKIFVRL